MEHYIGITKNSFLVQFVNAAMLLDFVTRTVGCALQVDTTTKIHMQLYWGGIWPMLGFPLHEIQNNHAKFYDTKVQIIFLPVFTL